MRDLVDNTIKAEEIILKGEREMIHVWMLICVTTLIQVTWLDLVRFLTTINNTSWSWLQVGYCSTEAAK